MASSIPNQSRVIDPFSSYGSDVVNELTTMITRGADGLTDYNSMQVGLDTTSPLSSLVVTTGSIFKDNVFITFTSEHTVDFTDATQYEFSGAAFGESGRYYLVLDYTYAKSRPAPSASVKILRPSDIPTVMVGTTLFFLKAVDVIYNIDHFEITTLYDYDPTYPDTKREYTPLYFGTEHTLPTHVPTRDQGRVVYETTTDIYWFGKATEWVELGTGTGSGSTLITSVDTDDPSLWVGALAYVDSGKTAKLALASSPTTRCDFAILTQGTVLAETASATLVGEISGVRIENGQSVVVGDKLYLSDSEAGTVTPIRPSTNIQQVGTSLDIATGDGTASISMIFIPRAMISTSITGTILSSEWGLSGDSYRADIDITALDVTSTVIVTSFFADNTSTGIMELIQPENVQLLDTGSGGYDTLRVWMTTNTLDVSYNLSSGTGGSSETGSGGTGGTTNHALLTNLTYATSGHTGFSPNPHSNADHSDPPSIPSGEIILFEKDTAASGYVVLTTVDDQLLYITKGSASGGETGGTSKSGSTWTQPNHVHTISTEASHSHIGGYHALTVPEMPSHQHSYSGTVSLDGNAPGAATYPMMDNQDLSTGTITVSASGGGLTHNHGSTSSSGSHNHGGSTGSGAPVNTWRPAGRNFTRQQKV